MKLSLVLLIVCLAVGTIANPILQQEIAIRTPKQIKLMPAFALKSPSESCKDNTDCNTGVCCPVADGSSFGCCPFQKGVCCGDKLHCCPYDYVCKDDGTCKENLVLDTVPQLNVEKTSPFVNKRKLMPAFALKSPSDTCKDESDCNTGACCPLADSSTFACCPFQKGVCCKDKLHCCPYDYVCRDDGKCKENFLLDTVPQLNVERTSPSDNKIDALKSPESVLCPDGGTNTCPDGNTCCFVSPMHYGCCPELNAVCCDGGKICCPHGYTCNPEGGTCMFAEGALLKNIPAISVRKAFQLDSDFL